MGTALGIGILLSYGAAVHFATATGAILPLVALLLLVTLAATFAAWRRRPRDGLLLLACAAVLLLIGYRGHGLDLLYLPPVLITGLVLWAFARSLAPGRTPLITLFAQLLEGELDEATVAYTRRATRWWLVFVALLLAENLALALWAPREIWSLFAHFINYLLLGGFFLVEYLLRRHCLPQRTHAGFFTFLRNLARLDLRAATRQDP